MINVDFGMTEAQMTALAVKWGYTMQIEDTSQPLEGDSYPLINNPESVSEWMAPRISEFIKQAVFDKLRGDLILALDNLHEKAKQAVTRGNYDADILAGNPDIFSKIISDLGGN